MNKQWHEYPFNWVLIAVAVLICYAVYVVNFSGSGGKHVHADELAQCRQDMRTVADKLWVESYCTGFATY